MSHYVPPPHGHTPGPALPPHPYPTPTPRLTLRNTLPWLRRSSCSLNVATYWLLYTAWEGPRSQQVWIMPSPSYLEAGTVLHSAGCVSHTDIASMLQCTWYYQAYSILRADVLCWLGSPCSCTGKASTDACSRRL